MKNSPKRITLSKPVKYTAITSFLLFYSVSVYNVFFSVISKNFFLGQDSFESALTVLSYGFISRFAGALLLGYLIGIIGRRKSILLCAVLVGIPSLIIGVLPSAQSIGWYAPLLLTLCVMMQGFGIGGFYNTAGIFAVEHSSQEKKGISGAILTSAGLLGFFFACVLGAICSAGFLQDTAWRGAFILGILPLIYILYQFKNIPESPEFLSGKDITKTQSLIQSILAYPVSFFKTLGIGLVIDINFLSIFCFVNPLLRELDLITYPTLMILNASLIFTEAICILASNKIGEILGFKKLMNIACFLIILLPLPLFYGLSAQWVPFIICIEIFYIIALSFYGGPMHAYMNELFPVFARGAITVGFTFGSAVLGGMGPTILAQVIQVENSPMLGALCLSVCGIIGWVSTRTNNNKIFKSELLKRINN